MPDWTKSMEQTFEYYVVDPGTWCDKSQITDMIQSGIEWDDIYGIPNVVEVYYSGSHDNYFARVVNDDPNSPTSTVNRGREIVHRETDPQFSGEPTNRQVKDYATSLLSQLSSVEYTISYSHGYCPVRLYDCVRLNYERAGLMDIKAKVTRQSIECKPGCKVTETAVFTTNLWR